MKKINYSKILINLVAIFVIVILLSSLNEKTLNIKIIGIILGIMSIILLILIMIFFILDDLQKQKRKRELNIINPQKAPDFSRVNNITQDAYKDIHMELTKEQKELALVAYDLMKNALQAICNEENTKLKEYFSNELYNTYETKLNISKLKQEKRFTNEFEFIDAKKLEEKTTNEVES